MVNRTRPNLMYLRMMSWEEADDVYQPFDAKLVARVCETIQPDNVSYIVAKIPARLTMRACVHLLCSRTTKTAGLRITIVYVFPIFRCCEIEN